MTDSGRSRLYLSPPHMSGKELRYIEKAFESNYIAPAGPQITEFEEAFCNATGFKHCVAVSSGTAAIHLGLREVGVSSEDVVLASTLTFIGSISPILFQGAEPVFVDSDESTWNMDPVLLETEINHQLSLGKKIGAVLPTDIYGQSCDLGVIREICQKYQIPLVVDSAESLGASYAGRSVGKGASAAAFSFNGNKIITTSGGGMLASDDGGLIEHARYLSTQAREDEAYFEHREVGYNYRMSNLIAAVGIGQLEVLEDRVERKRDIFSYYSDCFEDIEGIELMPESEKGLSNRWLTVILIDPDLFGEDREQVRLRLEEENIEARPMWKPMHQQPVFAGKRVVGGAVSDELFRKGLCLPSGTALMNGDLDRIVETVLRSRGI